MPQYVGNKALQKRKAEEMSASKAGAPMSTQSKVAMGLQIGQMMGIGGSGGGSSAPTTDTTEGALGGAMQGGLAGMSTGNPYAAVGMAALGGITGAMGASSARKAKLAQIEGEKLSKIAEAEAKKEARKQDILGKIGAGFQDSLLRKI
jgi:hypothetical protein